MLVAKINTYIYLTLAHWVTALASQAEGTSTNFESSLGQLFYSANITIILLVSNPGLE